MAFVQTWRPQTGGGSGSQTLAWAADEFPITDPFTPGSLELNLSQTPLDPDSVLVWSEGQPLESSGYAVLSGPSRVQILFGADPATDTDDGIWHFRVTYPYTT